MPEIAVMKVDADEAPGVDAVFAALASAPRRKVLWLLSEAEQNEHWAEQYFGERAGYFTGASCCAAEVCACCLGAWLTLAPSTVSHHMRRLIEAGLVSSRKEGLWVYYRLERSALEGAAEALREL